jgi:hypothetical protein
MPSTLAPYPESRVNPVNPPIQGDFSQLGLPEILDYLKTTSKTGVLVVRNGTMTKTLHFKDGVVVFATSNIPEERFGDMLLREGRITPDQFQQASLKVARGRRLGKILVEMKAITPKELWSEVRNQVAEIAYGVLQWDSGFFQFLEGEERTGENITTSIAVSELLLEGLRRIEDPGLFEKRIPSRDVVFERVLPAHRPQGLHFEEYEKHVFKLVNGTRSVDEICDLSEVGEFETLKTLYIFFSIGFLHVRRKKDRYAEEQREGQEMRDLVKDYNEMFSFVFHYLLREVGPIAENILDKYLGKLKTTYPEIFARVSLRSNGTLSDDRIMENLKAIPNQKRTALVQALNEYLYSTLLAVRRTLGAEHEHKVLDTLRSTRKDLFRDAT